MLRFFAGWLRDAGFDSAICRSGWSGSPEFPVGEYSYVDVVVPTRRGKKMPMVVEPSLRAEFVMVRCSAVYGALVAVLPEVFVVANAYMESRIRADTKRAR